MDFTGIIMMVGFFAIFYFLIIRPQKKKDKQVREMRDSLKVGDEVITIGGMHGTVVKIKEDILTIEVGSDKTKLVFSKWAIGSTNKKED